MTAPTPEEEPKVVIRDRRRIDPETGEARHPVDAPSAGTTPADGAAPADGASVSGASVSEARGDSDAEKLRTQLDERTADLQRVTAEYANYRRRVDRDRTVASDQATAAVLTALLPVLDDVDRARAHGDLTGAFAAVAEQLTAALQRVGLSSFGEAGDAFDPVWHEAVLHTESPDVAQPTCVDVMRRGYALGDRMLRPAMVAVADPAEPAPGPAGNDPAPVD
ncbi:MAG: GrpE protein [Mycobacterium sp.]|nr:GrpE protein [Mycobacterium sp.]